MILVTGDVVLDCNLHVGRRMEPSSVNPGTLMQKAPGGSMLTYGILEAIGNLKPLPNQSAPPRFRAGDLVFGLKERAVEELEGWPKGFRNYAIWEPDDPPKRLKNDKNLRWRLRRDLGFEDSGPKATGIYPAHPIEELQGLRPRILVVDDGALGFRHATASDAAHSCWPKLIRSGPEAAEDVEWILLKMASPLAGGDLWQALKAKWKKKLIVLVAARDLRKENIVLAQGLSWEQTVEDVLRQIDNHPALSDLAAARHIVITLRGDGALWLDNPGDCEKRRAQLVFDPARGEGEWEYGGVVRSGAYGFLSVMATSLAWRLWESSLDGMATFDLTPAMRAGLSASRILWENGNGVISKKGDSFTQFEPTGFPFAAIAEELQKPVVTVKAPAADSAGKPAEIVIDRVEKLNFDYGSVRLSPDFVRCLQDETPSSLPKTRSIVQRTILAANTETAALAGPGAKPMPLLGPARRLALFGPAALPSIPCARFGALQTMDRADIEALRSIKQLMLAYDAKPTKQPLSIAVFGAPGSGKSFGLAQIAKGVFGDKVPILNFNLSQFAGPGELYGAYHQVRDKALAGDTPVVFWDEFDSSEYKWLQYLLAPMQDGIFQEGQLTHSIGRSVFIFAGGTSYDYEHFGPSELPQGGESEEQRKARSKWVMSKGPDFKSRLSAYLNVLGPNPHLLYDSAAGRAGGSPWNDHADDVSYPMRRALLLRGFLGAKEPDSVLRIDRGLLTALLEVGHYRNGARSMEKLLAHLRGPEGEPPSRALLPHRDLMEMFVREVDDFYRLLKPMNTLNEKTLELAKAIHAAYCRNNAGKAGIDPNSLKSWDDLTPELRHSNLAAAERITEILALIGCTVESGPFPKEEKEAILAVIHQNLDLMAEEEHNGWWDTKRADGYRYGPVKDPVNREHPLMIPYSQLPESEKDKDRNAMLDYPDLLGDAGFRIVPCEPNQGGPGIRA
jgi:hypothetical protein